jgi:hypothetical protein
MGVSGCGDVRTGADTTGCWESGLLVAAQMSSGLQSRHGLADSALQSLRIARLHLRHGCPVRAG